jgi:crossover junction endodeoxyribonuclease RuvC
MNDDKSKRTGNTSVKILGIDPGIGRTGWGVIEVQSSKFKIQNYGCIETSKELPLEKRIESLYDQLSRIIKEEKPDEIAVEELFFNTNVKTALAVGQARGVVLLLASQNTLPLGEYSPMEVKLAITGYGKAEKRQVEQMMMALLKLKVKPKIDDTSDALAVALTHAFSRKLQKLT